jgi:rhomboid protease GluP
MTITEGSQPETEQWEAFALALTAPLGPFPQVHLAPKFPPELLNAALASYLPLQEDELLLAMIDRGAESVTGLCALTTRRIYWTERDLERERPRGARLKWTRRRATHGLALRVADYADLPDHIEAIATPEGSFAISLAGRATIELGRIGSRLASALVHYLETMRTAARAGAPPVGAIDPELAARAALALPNVARVTAKGRAFAQELSQFRAALQSATRHTAMTQVFAATCIIVYLAMVATGVHWLWPTQTNLVDWGANQGVGVAISQQYWRLFTSVFLHGGMIHLATNMWSLVVIGPLVERLYGNLAFTVIYLAAGVGGAIASLTASPLRVGVGASGAICGVLGGLVAFLIVHRRAIPKAILKSFRGSLLLVVILMAILGYMVPNIDQEAHAGGFVTGFLAGLLLSRPWPVVKSRWATLRRLVAPLLLAGALAGFAHAVAQRARVTLLSEFRPQLIADRIGPAFMEYQNISNGAPSTLLLSRDRVDPAACAAHRQTIEALIERSLANLATLRRHTTAYPPLRTMEQTMVAAQASQLSSLRAAERYLETGDRRHLSGPGGVLAEKIAATEAMRSFQEQEINFVNANKHHLD